MAEAKGGTVERVGLRIAEVAAAVGVSRRTLEREIAAGRFPRADARVGTMGLWKPATLKAWMDGGSDR
jgi:predicted DNA-binding transcriptional regulator AlpA